MFSRRTSGLLLLLILVGITILLGISVGLPAVRLNAAQAEIAQAVIAEAQTTNNAQTDGQPVGQTVVSDIQMIGEWSFGFLVTRAPDGIHAEPDLRLFIAKRDESGARVSASLEYTPEFYALLDQVPVGLIPQAGLDILRQSSSVIRGENAARALNYGLPWAAGQTWTMTGGPHPDSGMGDKRPWSAIDLAYGPSVGVIRAAESGVVWRSSDCPNFIRIDHGGGYRTGYYHVVNERVTNGQNVIRGDALASEGMGTGCGGYTTGPHVHFSMRYYDTRIEIGGTEFGGWEVQDGGSPYNGCMLRLRDNYQACTPRALVTYEQGVLPVISDLRYDYNRDSRPDLWVVNSRPSDGGTTVINIYDGSGFTSALPVPRTSLPQQPVELNTAFMAGDYNGDGTPDLWLVHRRLDSSGVSALRIIDGANPQYLLLDTPTVFPQYGDEVRFALADYNRDGVLDLYAIVPDVGANNVKIRVANGMNLYELLTERAAAIPAPNLYDDIVFALADYDADGRADLWSINPRDTTANAVTVTILGGNAFSSVLKQVTTNLPVQETDPDRFAFIVTDYNRDGTPDLWTLTRASGSLTITSGLNFTTSLYSGPTGASRIHQPQMQVMGSDRAKLRIPPQQVRLLTPNDSTVVIDPSVTLRFRPSGLAKNMQVYATDANGTLLMKAKAPKNTSPACIGGACIVDTQALGLQLRDGQTIYWKIVSKNRYGSSTSVTRSFTVDLPGPVNILSPLDQQTLTAQPQFTWVTRPTAIRYRLIVRNNQTGIKSKLIVEASGCTTMCAVTVGIPLASGSYWVRVVSYDAAGGISNSPKHHFVLNIAPPTLTPVVTDTPIPTSTPVSSPTSSLTPTLTPTVNPNATLPLPTAPSGFRSP
jgi:LasA protease